MGGCGCSCRSTGGYVSRCSLYDTSGCSSSCSSPSRKVDRCRCSYTSSSGWYNTG